MKGPSMPSASWLAKALIAVAALLLPREARARYRREWMAEFDEYKRESISPTPPALRILLTAPVTRRSLRPTNQDPIRIMHYLRVLSLLHTTLVVAPEGIPGRLGDRLFAINDVEAYWRGWQITRKYGGSGRRYRSALFDTINPIENHNQPAA